MAKRKRKRKQSFSGGLGCFILFGILALMGSVTQLVEEAPGVAYFLFGIIGMLVVLGIGLPKYRQKQQQKLLQQQQQIDSQVQQEKNMYRIALQAGGRLTAIEAAAELSLSIEEAEDMLKDIVNRGHATAQMSEKGFVIYTFPISDSSSKSSAYREPPPSENSQSANSHREPSSSGKSQSATLQCLISGKIVAATPEEHVRQQVAARLITKYGYQQSDMEVEFPIMMGRARKRADIVIFPSNVTHTQEHIWCIIETKARSVREAELKKAIGQLKSYVAASMNCQYAALAWTKLRIYQIVAQDGRRTFVQKRDFPIKSS